MPNRELAPFLVDTVTRRRHAAATYEGGQTIPGGESVLAGLEAGIKPDGGQLARGGAGVVAEGRGAVLLQPEADVLEGDILVVTAGAYAGQWYKVHQVLHGSLVPSRKATVERIPPPAPAGA